MTNKYALLVLSVILFSSCKKFLDEKPDRSLAVPQTISDAQALLDNNERMNSNCPASGEASTDSYYMTIADFNAAPGIADRSLYLWGDEIIYNTFPNDWSYAYMPVYHANLALEHIEKIQRTATNAPQWDNVKGSALLYRARCFLTAVAIWSKAYNKSTAASDPGIPLRLSSDFNQPSQRASVQAVYDQIITDLQQAIPLLPLNPAHVIRPSKAAAYALLSRTFLYMQQYQKAGQYADSCLQLHSTLLDYNTLNADASYPVPQFNKEVIMHFTMKSLGQLSLRVDSVLYNSYEENDLRKKVFFNSNNDGSYGFKGSYDGSYFLFCGITTGELYLTRAECYARAGNITAAMDDLNALFQKRFKTGTFTRQTAASKEEALDKVLAERRKELLLRDLRWMDIKRLNLEGYTIILKRVLDTKIVELVPNDPKYALPLPATVIAMTGMPQNPR
jgi:starch-binding outer membrane protein, SusD/RagB family